MNFQYGKTALCQKVSRLMVLKLWFNLLPNSQVSLSIARLLRSTTNTKLVKTIATKSIKPVSDGKGLPLIPFLRPFPLFLSPSALPTLNLRNCFIFVQSTFNFRRNFITTKAMEIIQTLNFAIKVNKIENLQFVSIRKIIHVPHQSQ